MQQSGWLTGDLLGHVLPAHGEALGAGGAAFLTDAFRASGAIAGDNRVTAITQLDPCPGGSTGSKLLLGVEYAIAEPGLPTDLFVKFSRDFDDPIRDAGKVQMEGEVRFALLSRLPGFPVAVPRCLFADYELASGTGVLITERVAFGTGAIEPHYDKCCDYEVPALLAHYEALVSALGRLAGTHRAGRFPEELMAQFAADPEKLVVNARKPYTPQQLGNRVARYAAFAARVPQILPPAVRSEAFIARLSVEAPMFAEHMAAVEASLHDDPEAVALCHWNANIDNGWFWRDADGKLQCGLMDWGNVGQMNMAVALAGCLMAAEPEFVTANLDHLLARFAAAFAEVGGGAVDVERLKQDFAMYIASSGLRWLLDAPPLIERLVPDLADVESRFDPRLRHNEGARAQLHMLTLFLTLWQALDFGGRLRRLVGEDVLV